MIRERVAQVAKRKFREKTTMVLAEPDAFPNLCAFISTGGTLAEWVAANDVAFLMTRAFINSTEERRCEYQAALTAREEYLTDGVVSSLRNISDSDPRKAFDESGKLKRIHDLPDDLARAITSIEVSEDATGKTTHRVRFVAREKAYEMLGRHLGMYKDRMEMTGANGAPLITNSEFQTAARALLEEV